MIKYNAFQAKKKFKKICNFEFNAFLMLHLPESLFTRIVFLQIPSFELQNLAFKLFFECLFINKTSNEVGIQCCPVDYYSFVDVIIYVIKL